MGWPLHSLRRYVNVGGDPRQVARSLSGFPTYVMTPPNSLLSSAFARSLVLVALMCAFAFPSKAQVEVKVGFKEGGNFATLGGADGQVAAAPAQNGAPLNRRPGLIIGGLVELDPSGPLGVQSEVLWIWKGAKVLSGDTKATTKVNYLEFPVLAKYETPLTVGPVSTHLLAGPTVALVTQASRELTATDGQGQTRLVDRADLTEAVRNVELGLAIGGGAAYQFSGRAALTVGMRYRRGLTSTFGEGMGTQSAAPDAWNQGLSLSLGFVYSSGWSL